MMPLLWTTLLLTCSNVFMTFAWYAHLRNLTGRPWYIATAERSAAMAAVACDRRGPAEAGHYRCATKVTLQSGNARNRPFQSAICNLQLIVQPLHGH